MSQGRRPLQLGFGFLSIIGTVVRLTVGWCLEIHTRLIFRSSSWMNRSAIESRSSSPPASSSSSVLSKSDSKTSFSSVGGSQDDDDGSIGSDECYR